jgi:hypothetical protein
MNHGETGTVLVFHGILCLFIHMAWNFSIILPSTIFAAALRLFVLGILVLGEIVLLQ